MILKISPNVVHKVRLRLTISSNDQDEDYSDTIPQIEKIFFAL